MIDVEEGAHVETRQQVGLVGATGRVTGPHLHWAVRLNNARVDPLSVLATSRPLEAAPLGAPVQTRYLFNGRTTPSENRTALKLSTSSNMWRTSTCVLILTLLLRANLKSTPPPPEMAKSVMSHAPQ